jgi:hypothetical protein
MESRLVVWCVMALLTLAVGGVAYAQRPSTKPVRAPETRPSERAPALLRPLRPQLAV